MRIAHIMAGAPAGGAELFFERLAAAQQASGESVLPLIRHDPARAARLSAAGLAPIQLRFGGALDLLTRPRLRAALRRFAPRVAVAWMNRAARMAPRGSWVLAGRLGGYYDLRYYRRCDHLIGNTRGITDWIIAQGWPAARVHHLPNFSPDLRGAAPAALPTPLGAPVVLALGRLHRNKAFDILIRALPLLPGVHAVIAGEGPERPALLGLASQLGVASRLHLLGWRTDQAALLAACTVLACPSRHEPLGNVVLEAFSAARPVVAADAAGPSELIACDNTGLLVPRDDPTRLAQALGAILHDPALAACLANAGRACFEANHQSAPVLQRWQTALAQMEQA
ncbi:MAG TPA: glycosyltransferase [Acetobacteraceae bacterium]